MWGLVGDGRAPLGQRTHQLQTPFLCHPIGQFLQHSEEVKVETEYKISRRKQLEIQTEQAQVWKKICVCYHDKDHTHNPHSVLQPSPLSLAFSTTVLPLHLEFNINCLEFVHYYSPLLLYLLDWYKFFQLYNISHHSSLVPSSCTFCDSITTMPVIFTLKYHLNPPPHSSTAQQPPPPPVLT